jgi:hypothetical protein
MLAVLLPRCWQGASQRGGWLGLRCGSAVRGAGTVAQLGHGELCVYFCVMRFF